MMHTARKGWGAYPNIMGLWGREQDLLTPDIDLLAGPHRPKYSSGKNFYADFGDEKCDIFDFFSKYSHIRQDGQYRISEGFLGSKGPISGQISYFRPLQNKISIFEKSRFFRFFDDFRDFSNLISGRNRPEVAGHTKNFQKCILWTLQKYFHSYNIYIA